MNYLPLSNMIDYVGWWDLKVVRNIAQSAKCTPNRENQARIAKRVPMTLEIGKNGKWPEISLAILCSK